MIFSLSPRFWDTLDNTWAEKAIVCIYIYICWPTLPQCRYGDPLTHSSFIPFYLPSSARPLPRLGQYCLGSAIEYSICSVCWSSKLPCVKSIPLAPGGVVISLKMKLPLISYPYSSTAPFSGRLGPCRCGALWRKPIRQIFEECTEGAVIPGCQEGSTLSYKYISHAGLEVTPNCIIFLF